MRGGVWMSVAATAATAAMLAGCERGASAPARAHDSADRGSTSRSYASDSAGARDDDGRDRPSSASSRYAREDRDERDGPRERTREAVPMFHGEPLWADNRRHTAEENASYHCDKSGPDIGAHSLDDCLAKVHAFLDHPPAGAQTLTRDNGDRLVYDPKANLFAVARKDGAPRTFFKPRDGAGYWKEQQDEARDGGRYRRRSGGDEGAGAGETG